MYSAFVSSCGDAYSVGPDLRMGISECDAGMVGWKNLATKPRLMATAPFCGGFLAFVKFIIFSLAFSVLKAAFITIRA